MSVTDFLHSVKARADELALLGAPMDDDDLTERILDELDDDYKELVRAVQARDTSISFDELHEKLLSFEATLQDHKRLPSTVPVTANPAARSGSNWRPSQPQQNWRPSFSGNTGWRQQPSQVHRPSSSHNGPPNRGNQQGPRPYLGKCQVCGVQGHSAKRCPSFQMVSTQSSAAPQHATSP